MQWNLGLTHAFSDGLGGPLTARFDVVNFLDRIYEIRSSTGIGVIAPQVRGTPSAVFWGVTGLPVVAGIAPVHDCCDAAYTHCELIARPTRSTHNRLPGGREAGGGPR
jgi:hypothetical protein